MGSPNRFDVAGLVGSRAFAYHPKHEAPMVFIHGLFRTHHDYDPWLEYFCAAGFDCYAVSARGRLGILPEGGEGLTFDDFVDDAKKLVDHVGDHPIIVGHSLGGLVAQKIAEAGLARALVLLASIGPAGAQASRNVVGLPSLLQVRTLARSGHSLALTTRQATRLFFNELPEQHRRVALEAMVPDSGEAMRNALAGVPVDEHAVRIPVLCIGGLQDRTIPPSSIRNTARKYAARIKLYEGFGHYLIQAPGCSGIAKDIREWIWQEVPMDDPSEPTASAMTDW